VRLEARVSGPIVFYPSVAIKASGLTYKIRALNPPLELALDTLTGVYDLAVDEGSIDEFIARGTGEVGGAVRISAKFGGDGSDRSPFWVDSNVDINQPIDMASYLPASLAGAVGTRLDGRFHALRRKGDTAYGVSVDQLDLSLGRLRVNEGQVYIDKSLDKILLDGVRVAMPGFVGTVRCTVYTGSEQLRFDRDDCEAAIEIGDIQQLVRAFSSPRPPRSPAPAVHPRRAAGPAHTRPDSPTPIGACADHDGGAARLPTACPETKHSFHRNCADQRQSRRPALRREAHVRRHSAAGQPEGEFSLPG
jgi:hypothetical protein